MFQFTKTSLGGLFLIEPDIFSDDRGYFMESYSKKAFQNAGIDCNFVQDNHSKSDVGVLRGLHLQRKHAQAKLIRVVSGSIYDVSVDLRGDSQTFGKWFGVVLSAKNKKQLFIPRGFAHGFLSLENATEVVYKCDDFYFPEFGTGIMFDDTFLAIDWEKHCKKKNMILSERDRNHLSFTDFCKNNPF